MSEQHYSVDTYRSQDSVGYLLKRAQSLILFVMEPVLEVNGFTFLQYLTLVWVRDGVAVNPKDICAKYGHNSGALTRVIDQLADRGLLERVRGDRDRRKVELRLTTDGRAAVNRLIPLVVENLNLILADFSAWEVNEFHRLLLKLNSKLAILSDRPLSRAKA